MKLADIMLTERSNAITTPEFKRWFVNSKVVDDQGRPLVVYHGTKRSFSSFDAAAKASSLDAGDGNIYFAASPDTANFYAGDEKTPGGHVIPCFLRITNPQEVSARQAESP